MIMQTYGFRFLGLGCESKLQLTSQLNFGNVAFHLAIENKSILANSEHLGALKRLVMR